MKYLLLLTVVLFSCEKEETQTCKTCYLDVHVVVQSQSSTDYIGDIQEVCDGSWQQMDGKVIESGSQTGHGTTTETTKTWRCE